MLHSGIIQKTGDSLKCSFVCFWSSKAYEGGHHVTACASLCRLGSLLTGQIRTFDSLSNCLCSISPHKIPPTCAQAFAITIGPGPNTTLIIFGTARSGTKTLLEGTTCFGKNGIKVVHIPKIDSLYLTQIVKS